MLALKTALEAQDRVDLLLFDEVDSGIGGAVAQAVGERLRRLARHRQVLCVTHLPMIAALASHHIARRQGRTPRAAPWPASRSLRGERRVDELARMLAGRARLRAPRGARRASCCEAAEHAGRRPMIVPALEEFRTLARGGKLVPVYREVFADHDTPVSAFRKIDDGPYGFLLESVEGGEKWGRYSLLGSRPSVVFIARGRTCEIHEGGKVTRRQGSRRSRSSAALLAQHQAIALPGLPRFCGGAVGYLGYDTVRWFEKLPRTRRATTSDLPDAVFLFGDVVSVFDNLTHTMKVVTHARGGGDPDARVRRRGRAPRRRGRAAAASARVERAGERGTPPPSRSRR